MLTIRLLGPPAIERDGQAVRAPRGRKAWALLAYLLLSERPPARSHLAALLFGNADDPLGALRWTLAELRRCLGDDVILGGDPVTVVLSDGALVDALMPGGEVDDAFLLRTDSELLESVNLADRPEFESWLLVQRHQVSAALEARLRQATVALLATGRPADAIAYAARAVALNPLEEGNHELLVRSLAMAGDRNAALKQIAVCADTLRRELGTEISPTLREAANSASGSSTEPPLSGRAAGASQLEAGRAAIDAGAVEAGLQCLRRAVAEADRSGDVALHGRALAALGGALVHAVRGQDGEGAVALRQSIDLAALAGDRVTSVMAHRELGYIEVQAGRRRTAETWLEKAEDLAETDEELAAVLGVRGMHSSDRGDYPAAFAYLNESVERAARCADDRQRAWSLSILARSHLLRGESDQAALALQASLTLVHQQRWMAFLPLPQTMQAEILCAAGNVTAATDGFEQAWSLACQVGDPCWEGLAARGLGMLSANQGDHASADKWLDEASARCNRVTDRNQWVAGYVLEAVIRAALDHGDSERAQPLVARLSALAARCEMRELLVQAQLHQGRLGDRTAFASARQLGAEIDNPALHRLIDRYA